MNVNPVSVEEIPAEEAFIVYPNPAQDYAMLKFGETPLKDYTVKVYDHAGQVVIEKVVSNGQQELELITSQLSAGMFIVQLETESEVLSKEKLIVVH